MAYRGGLAVDLDRANEYEAPHARSGGLNGQVQRSLNIRPAKFVQTVVGRLGHDMHTGVSVYNLLAASECLRPIGRVIQ